MSDTPTRRERLPTVLLPALLAPAQLLLFGPHTTYAHNRAEFAVSFRSLATEWLWLLGAVVFTLAAVGVFLPGRLLRPYVALLFGLGLLLWLQGNLLLADYGPLYGEGLDLASHAWRAPYELGLWVAGLGLMLYFSRAIFSVARLVSGVLIVAQTALLASAAASGHELQPEGQPLRQWSSPPDRIYRLSRERNVIHIVLDGFLSEIFGEILARERATFDRDFSGFVFFADHLGAFPSTRASMPAMQTGIAYRNDRPFEIFRREIGRKPSIAKVLARQRYRIHSVSFHHGEHPPPSLRHRVVRYRIPTPYGSYESYVRLAAAQVLDLTLFRHVPHGLKTRVYNDDAWLVQRPLVEQSRASKARSFRASNHVAFLDEATARMTVGFRLPVYLFIHVAIPHPPIVVDADCSFIGRQPRNRTTFAAQARCGLTVVQRLLDKLRALGVYDRSIILLTSDHGWYLPRADHPLRHLKSPVGSLDRVALGAMPLLAIKPAGRSGPLQTSYAPTALTDIPATILDLVSLKSDSLPGEPAFGLDATSRRRRTYAFHTWKNADWSRPYFDVLHLFAVEGRVLDPDAWTFEKSILDPTRGGATGTSPAGDRGK